MLTRLGFVFLLSVGGCNACGEFASGFKEGWNEGMCEETSRSTSTCSSCCKKASGAEGRFAQGKCACVNAAGK